MRIRYICKCGLENYTFGDWTAHWKYGIVRSDDNWMFKYPKLRAIYLFLFTKIEVN